MERLRLVVGAMVSGKKEGASGGAGAGAGGDSSGSSVEGSITVSRWMELAAAHLHWAATDARVAFDICQLFLNHADASDSIPVVEFCLYLFIQLYSHPKPLSVSKQHPDTSWPDAPALSPSMHARSPVRSPSTRSPVSGSGSPTGSPMSSPRSLALVLRGSEQTHRLQFVKTSIAEVFSLVFSGRDIPRDAFDSLGFLFHGGSSQTTQSPSLSSLYPSFSASASASSSSVSAADAAAWISEHLGVNELAYPPSGARSSAGTTHPSSGSTPSALSSASSPGAPASSSGDDSDQLVISPVIVSNVHKSTVFKTSPAIAPPGGGAAASSMLPDARVEQCHDAFIYLLCPVRCVSILASSNCTIVVGAVAGVVSVDLCSTVRIVVATAQLRINNCVDSLFQVYTPRAPLILGDCRGLTLAPHCAQYVGMRTHLACVGLDPAPESHEANLWSSPVSLTSSTASTEAASSPVKDAERPKPFALLEPEKFQTMIVPLPGAAHPGRADAILALPPSYSAAIASKRESVRHLRAKIKAAGLDEKARAELQGAVQTSFREWLLSSGHIRQIADLVRLTRETEAREPSSPSSVGKPLPEGSS